MADIALSHVTKKYGRHVTVNDVSLDIAQGELVALVGPSGCGKTTTLRMIAGLTEMSSGRILFDSRDVSGLPTYRRNTGIVFQGYALFPHMTVADNVAFGLQMRGIPASEVAQRVADALAMVRLAPYADRLPRELSGGQQQRVALARAFAIKPDALLLDEPLSALDAKLRQEVRVEIRRLQQSLGLTTVFVTHDQEEAVSIADRIVVMNAGRIEQVGTPQQVYENPGHVLWRNSLVFRISSEEPSKVPDDFGPAKAPSFSSARGELRVLAHSLWYGPKRSRSENRRKGGPTASPP
jgi:putative spermidine/putrescine transport system ATP-binding protein